MNKIRIAMMITGSIIFVIFAVVFFCIPELLYLFLCCAGMALGGFGYIISAPTLNQKQVRAMKVFFALTIVIVLNIIFYAYIKK